ncbi:hypothetical protein ACWCXB_22960 [Streptomyces sp. NPDC001514]
MTMELMAQQTSEGTSGTTRRAVLAAAAGTAAVGAVPTGHAVAADSGQGPAQAPGGGHSGRPATAQS